MSEYEDAVKRSVNAYDLTAALEAYEKIKDLAALKSGWIDAAEFVLVSEFGYVIGTWWWDSENEQWLLDLQRLGEKR